MSVRVRFAPSPTGQVHIGNIRAAIFNWLFAHHEGGSFLLRIEDTDLERSTPEAIATLLEVMEWLKLDFDEKPPLYQTSQVQKHLAAAQQLLAQGDAYKDNKGGNGEAILFRIPFAGDPLVFYASSAVFMAANLTVGVTVSSIARNQLQALQMTIFYFLPNLMLSGFMFPFAGMPDWAQAIGCVLPLTHFNRIVRGVLLKGSGWPELWPELWPIALFAGIVLVLAVASFRRTLD